MTCYYSSCVCVPPPFSAFFALSGGFVNRTNSGTADGRSDTVVSFRGSPSSSRALVCCLLAACWSFPCNTQSCKGDVFPHLTHRWYLPILSIISSWDRHYHSSKWMLNDVPVCVREGARRVILCICWLAPRLPAVLSIPG